MPPAGEKQPDQAEVDAVIHYLETSLDAAAKDQAAKAERVGHVPIQRLNRTEFAASVRDLIGVQVDPKQVLPTEIEVEGFSNISGALGISPSFMEQYLSAARRVAQRAVGEPIPKTASVFYGGGGGGGGQAGPGSPTQLTHKDGYPPGHPRRRELYTRLPCRWGVSIQLHGRGQFRRRPVSAWYGNRGDARRPR